MRLFILQKTLLQFFQTKDYKIQKILEDINFILDLSYSSDILGVMDHCNCYLQGSGSNIVDFAMKLATSGVGKVRLASHKRLFDPRDVALQLFVRNTEDLVLFCNCTYTPYFQLLCGRGLFFTLSSAICISCGVEDFLLFDSPVATLRLFYFSGSGFFNKNFAHP